MAEEVVSLVANLRDNVSNAAYKIIRSIDEIGDRSQKTSPKIRLLEASIDEEGDTAKRTAAFNLLHARSIKKMGYESLKAEAKMRLLERRMRKMARAGAMGGGSRGRGGRDKSNKRDSGGGMGGMIAGAGGMPITMAVAAASTLGALLPALSAGVGALGAAALGAVGALAPLAGLIIAYPGYMAALGQGLVVTKMAFAGVGDAVKALTEPGASLSEINIAMQKLGPSGQVFAKTVSGMKGDLDGLTKNIQSILLPSFSELANTARTYMPMVERAFNSTAFAIKGTVDSFREYLAEGRTQGQVGQILANNTAIVTQFGAAGVSGIKVLVDLLTAAGPLLIRMSQDISRFMQSLSDSSGANTSGLSNFFESTYSVLQKTVGIASDVLAALYNITSIGVPLGSAMGDSFTKMAENFRAFTESTGGIQKIRDWFIEMTPVVYELGYLVRDVSAALFGLGGNGNAFITISQTLREDILPLFVQFVENISGNLIPTLLELVKTVVEFFTAIDPLAAIIPILTVIGAVFKVVVDAIEMLGGAGKVMIAVFVAAIFTIKLTTMSLVMLAQAKARAALATRTLNAATAGLSSGLQRVGISATIAAVGIRGMMLATGAIGIGLMVLGSILSTFISTTKESTEANDTWAQSLFDANGALMENAAQQIASTLAQDGTLASLKALGIESGEATKAIFEGGNAYDDLIDKLYASQDALMQVVEVQGVSTKYHTAESQAVLDLINNLRGKRTSLEATTGAMGLYKNEINNITTATNDSADASTRLLKSMQKLDAFFSQRQSERAYRQDMRDLRKTLKDLGDEYGVNQLATDKIDASMDQFVGNQMERANKLAEEGNFTEAFKVMETVSEDAMRILTKNLGKNKATAAFDPIQTEINAALLALQALSREKFIIKVGYQNAGQVPSAAFTPPIGAEQRFAGGPIVGGRTYMVGELGPEAFVGRNGNVSLIGSNGPEITKFPQGGFVVPNHVLGGATDSSVPAQVMNAFTTAVAGRTSPSTQSSGYSVDSSPAVVNIGTINAQSDIDIIKAVKKGIAEAERNRRERT